MIQNLKKSSRNAMRKKLRQLSDLKVRKQEAGNRKPEKKTLLLSSCFVLLASCFLLFLSACGGKKSHPPWAYMPDMMETRSLKAQEWPMRTPPAGTVPR